MLAQLPEALGHLWASHCRKHVGEFMDGRGEPVWLSWGGTRREAGEEPGGKQVRKQVRNQVGTRR